MRLVENIPLDTQRIADLISDPKDLFLVWPLAKHPFDHRQWEKVLNPALGNRPFLVYEDNRLVGHAALCVTTTPAVYSTSFLYLQPDLRFQGRGRRLMTLLASYAKEKLRAERLVLVVRTYNLPAFRCYRGCGFEEMGRQGTLIRMSKTL